MSIRVESSARGSWSRKPNVQLGYIKVTNNYGYDVTVSSLSLRLGKGITSGRDSSGYFAAGKVYAQTGDEWGSASTDKLYAYLSLIEIDPKSSLSNPSITKSTRLDTREVTKTVASAETGSPDVMGFFFDLYGVVEGDMLNPGTEGNTYVYAEVEGSESYYDSKEGNYVYTDKTINSKTYKAYKTGPVSNRLKNKYGNYYPATGIKTLHHLNEDYEVTFKFTAIPIKAGHSLYFSVCKDADESSADAILTTRKIDSANAPLIKIKKSGSPPVTVPEIQFVATDTSAQRSTPAGAVDHYFTLFGEECEVKGEKNCGSNTIVVFKSRDDKGKWSDESTWSGWSSSGSESTMGGTGHTHPKTSGRLFQAYNTVTDNDYETPTANSGYYSQYKVVNNDKVVNKNYIYTQSKLNVPTFYFTRVEGYATTNQSPTNISIGETVYTRVIHADTAKGLDNITAKYSWKTNGGSYSSYNVNNSSYTPSAGVFKIGGRVVSWKDLYATSDPTVHGEMVSHVYHAPQINKTDVKMTSPFSVSFIDFDDVSKIQKQIEWSSFPITNHYGNFNYYKLKFLKKNSNGTYTEDYQMTGSNDPATKKSLSIDLIDLVKLGHLNYPGSYYKIRLVGCYKSGSKVYDGETLSTYNNDSSLVGKEEFNTYDSPDFLVPGFPETPEVKVPTKGYAQFDAYRTINPRTRIVIDCYNPEYLTGVSDLTKIVVTYMDTKLEGNTKTNLYSKNESVTLYLSKDENGFYIKDPDLLKTSSIRFTQITNIFKEGKEGVRVALALPSVADQGETILRNYSIKSTNDLDLDSDVASTPQDPIYWDVLGTGTLQRVEYVEVPRPAPGDLISSTTYEVLGDLMTHAIEAYSNLSDGHRDDHYEYNRDKPQSVDIDNVLFDWGSSYSQNNSNNPPSEESHNPPMSRDKSKMTATSLRSSYDYKSSDLVKDSMHRHIRNIPYSGAYRQIPRVWMRCIIEMYRDVKEWSPALNLDRVIDPSMIGGLSKDETIYSKDSGSSHYYQGNIFNLVYDGLKFML